MTSEMAKRVLNTPNYPEHHFNSLSGIGLLFDRVVIPQIASHEDFIAVDIFGNKTKIHRGINTQLGGYRFHVVNLNYNAPEYEPLQTAHFDDPLYCQCGQEIEEGNFDAALDLQRGYYYVKCNCGQKYKIVLCERSDACTMEVIYKLWQDCADVFPALLKMLFGE